MTEDELVQKCGKETPFSVPEGYFETLADRMIAGLPQDGAEGHKETVHVTLWQRVKPWIYMAAMFAGMSGTAGFFLERFTQPASTEVASAGSLPGGEVMTEEDIDTLVEYDLVDDYMLYRYLTEADF